VWLEALQLTLNRPWFLETGYSIISELREEFIGWQFGMLEIHLVYRDISLDNLSLGGGYGRWGDVVQGRWRCQWRDRLAHRGVNVVWGDPAGGCRGPGPDIAHDYRRRRWLIPRKQSGGFG